MLLLELRFRALITEDKARVLFYREAFDRIGQNCIAQEPLLRSSAPR
jgi:hypothetical protein